MKLIIAGSMDFVQRIPVFEIIEFNITFQGLEPDVVICGCVKGVDTLGAEWAFSKGIPIEYFPANWKKHGNRAGPLRNKQMANAADTLLVIRKADSKGSNDMLYQATSRGLEVHDMIIPRNLYPIYEGTD